MKRVLPYIALVSCTLTTPSLALDTLSVGASSAPRTWESIVESSHFVAVSEDSIWTWQAERGDNIAADLSERGGFIAVQVQELTPSGYVAAVAEREDLYHWVDGDGSSGR